MAWIICHKSTAWLLPDLFVSLLSGIPQNSVFLIRYLQGSWSHLTFVVIPDLKLYPTFCWLLHTKHHWSFFSRTFSEVLNSQLHYEFFKRFMIGENTIHPLSFWKSIEELRDMPPGRKRGARTRNIFRRNFSKKAKHGNYIKRTLATISVWRNN